MTKPQAYGADSGDTATAWNNEACCLYCLNKRSESRVKFERAWNIMCEVLGHRAARTVAVWKNLEKARRANGSVHGRQNLKDSIDMRPDSDRLLYGGEFIIR